MPTLTRTAMNGSCRRAGRRSRRRGDLASRRRPETQPLADYPPLGEQGGPIAQNAGFGTTSVPKPGFRSSLPAFLSRSAGSCESAPKFLRFRRAAPRGVSLLLCGSSHAFEVELREKAIESGKVCRCVHHG